MNLLVFLRKPKLLIKEVVEKFDVAPTDQKDSSAGFQELLDECTHPEGCTFCAWCGFKSA